MPDQMREKKRMVVEISTGEAGSFLELAEGCGLGGLG